MGAIWLSEVKENAQDLADHLELRPLERRRLLKALDRQGEKMRLSQAVSGVKIFLGPWFFMRFFEEWP